MPSLALQRVAQACQIFRPGILADGAREPCQRVVVLSAVERQLTQQVQGLGVIAIDCKRLLATKLGVERLSRLPVAKRGLKECGRRVGLRNGRVGPGFLTGCPAFAAAHRTFQVELARRPKETQVRFGTRAVR